MADDAPDRVAPAKDVEHLVTRGKALSQKVATYNQRVVGEGDSLAQEVAELRKEISLALRETSDDGEAEVLQRAKGILEGHGPGGDLRKLAKRPTPALLSLLVGARTNVVTLQRNEAIRLKEEYHAFRDRIGWMLSAASSALLAADWARPTGSGPSLTPPYMVAIQLFLCWLLYVYTALALRENVLKVNGSGIRVWWIRHHYWSIATCMLVLTLPVDSPSVQTFVRKWVWWSCWQGIVMTLQNRYQRRRMYTRIALGKNRAMDVVSGESSGGSGQLLLLYPLLFGLQMFQCVIGVQMILATAGAWGTAEGFLELESHESDLRGSRGVALAGGLMLFMGILNFTNTAGTIIDKRQTRKRMRSRQLLPTAPPETPPERSPAKPGGPAGEAQQPQKMQQEQPQRQQEQQRGQGKGEGSEQPRAEQQPPQQKQPQPQQKQQQQQRESGEKQQSQEQRERQQGQGKGQEQQQLHSEQKQQQSQQNE